MRTHAIRGMLAALVLALAAVTAAPAQTPAADNDRVAALTDTYFAAVYGYDESAVRAVTSPQFFLVAQDGRRLERESALGEMLQTFLVQNGYTSPTYRVDVLAVRPGDGGTLVADVRTVAEHSGLNGGPSPFVEELTTAHRLTWQQMDGKWLLAEDQIVDVSR